MQRYLIIATNCALLALLLIGLPVVAGRRFWDWEISSIPAARTLMFWGLALAAAGNGLAALTLVKGRRSRTLCWEWTAIFAGIVLFYWGFTRGYFNFNWLKQALLWLQNHL